MRIITSLNIKIPLTDCKTANIYHMTRKVRTTFQNNILTYKNLLQHAFDMKKQFTIRRLCPVHTVLLNTIITP